MFTPHQRNNLRDLVRPKIGSYYQGTDNHRLDEYIERLREQCPEHFHKDYNSLRSRTFFDEPVRLAGHSQLPMDKFIRPIGGWKR